MVRWAAPAAAGIGPAEGRWIQVAGLAGGQLPATTADKWQARLMSQGVILSGPAGESVTVREPEDIRAFGFSPDGSAFIVASSPHLVIFRRDIARRALRHRFRDPDMRQMRMSGAGRTAAGNQHLSVRPTA